MWPTGSMVLALNKARCNRAGIKGKSVFLHEPICLSGSASANYGAQLMDPQLLFGFAAVLSALASLVWAVRRRPREDEGGHGN